MHDCVGFYLFQGGNNLMALRTIALKEFRARIDSAAMAISQIIETGNFVAFVDEELSADASDVTSSSNDEYFHNRKTPVVESGVRNCGGSLRSAPFPLRRQPSGEQSGYGNAGPGFPGFVRRSPTQ